MKKLALSVIAGVVLFSLAAWAGVRPLGRVVSAAGADTSNISTATPFYVPRTAKLTVVCNAAAFVLTDTTTAVTDLSGANAGIPLVANEKLNTSTGAMVIAPTGTAAAGGSIVRISGPAAVTCWVFERRGSE